MKRVLVLLVVVALVLGVMVLGAGAAFAGEKKGPPGNLVDTAAVTHANSICAYSGLNDDPDDPEEGGRVQSWGQIPKDFRDFLTSIGEHPGLACHGGSNPNRGGRPPA